MSYKGLHQELRRFIYSIASIPHLEAILLLHQNPGREWDAITIARRLYVAEDVGGKMLVELSLSGICAERDGIFFYAPASEELDTLIASLADYYSSHLIEVTNMIHAKTNSGRVRLFADAFKFNKDK
jgi:hypothetical protein